MIRLLNLFLIPYVKKRLKELLIALTIIVGAYLFKNETILQILIFAAPGYFFMTDIMNFYYSKNIYWLTNSYFNKSDLIKYFFANQILRYTFVVICNSILFLTSVFLYFKLKSSGADLTPNITAEEVQAVSTLSKSMNASAIGSISFFDFFRVYLTYGLALTIGLPLVTHLSPMGAQHLTPQELAKLTYSKNNNAKKFFYIYAGVFSIGSFLTYINSSIYPVFSALSVFIPFLIYAMIASQFVYSFNKKFNLFGGAKVALYSSAIFILFSLPYSLNISIGLGRLHNPDASIVTKIREAKFLGILSPSPPKEFIKSALKEKNLGSSELTYLVDQAFTRHNYKFKDFADQIKHLETLNHFAQNYTMRGEERSILYIYKRMRSIDPNSKITKKFEKRFHKKITLAKRGIASQRKLTSEKTN